MRNRNRAGGVWPVRIRHLLGPLGLVILVAGCGQSDDSGATAAAHPGEETYNRFCFSCHQAGVAGAPRFGDAQAWAPRIAQGPDVLLAHTKSGVPPGMPAMGLCTSCTEQDLADAIDYMVSAASDGPAGAR